MPVDVTIWNMGHGEAMRLDVDNQISVVRDFGRSRWARETATSTTVQAVAPLLLAPPNGISVVDAVLSHAHEDHFAGFEQYLAQGPSVFSHSYIPWLDFSSANALGTQITVLSSYLYAYGKPTCKPRRSASCWFRAAPLLGSISNQLRGVSAGHFFASWRADAEALWPPPPGKIPGYDARQLARVKEAIARLGEATQLAERIETIAAGIAKVLAPYYGEHAPQGADAKANLLTVQAALDELTQVGYTLGAERFDSHIAQAVSFAWPRYKSVVDDHSLVFRFGGSALFLSDLHEECIEEMCSHFHGAARRYGLVKSAHHGTRFGDSLITYAASPDVLVHACGPAHVRYRGPTARYEQLKSTHLRPTDWNIASGKWMQRPQNYVLFPTNVEKFSV